MYICIEQNGGYSPINNQNFRIMSNQELINEAKKRVTEISEVSQSCPQGHRTTIYEGEDEIIVSHVRDGWFTRSTNINFGSKQLNEKQVLSIIDEEQFLEYIS